MRAREREGLQSGNKDESSSFWAVVGGSSAVRGSRTSSAPFIVALLAWPEKLIASEEPGQGEFNPL